MRTLRSLRLLTLSLEEMSIAWGWSTRALNALRQLAKEWSVSKEVENALGTAVENQRTRGPNANAMSTPLDKEPGQQLASDLGQWPMLNTADNSQIFDWTGFGFWDIENFEATDEAMLSAFNTH